MAVDHNDFDLFCPVCGLIDETPISGDITERWTDPIKTKKQTEYEKRIKRIEARLDPQKTRGGLHKSTNKKQLEEVMIDRRVENIIKSLEGEDRITDISFGKHKLLLDKYNSLYQLITYDQLRNSYDRFVKRQNKKIDDFIDKILSRAFNGIYRDVIYARLEEDDEEQIFTANYFPERFLYTGTDRTRLQYNAEMDIIHDKALKYYRKRLVEDVIANPKASIIISRNYKSDGKTKKIVFTFTGAHIYMHGDEIGSNFENFFLDYLGHALKRGRLGETCKCPGTKRVCVRHFRAKFSRVGGFHKATFYDAAPYIIHQESENAAMHSYL
jgi:uncharacterized Zn finger protein (UPF0148 family)